MPIFLLYFFFKILLLFSINIVDFDLLKFLPIILPILLSVAFFTVLERKVLASIQRRRGPNVVGIFGLLQAFADGIKLLLKETIIPSSSNSFIFILAPIFTFLLSLLSWSLIPFDKFIIIADINLSVLFLFAFSSLGVYGIIMSGWSSNSKYAFLGALRSSAQLISYEVSMAIIIMPILACSYSTNLTNIILAQDNILFCFIFFPSCILFFISILAETNRVPFDLPEAESELVSGYNVEYSSVGFVLFFLAEYSNIILMSAFMACLFFGGWLPLFFFYFIPGWFWLSLKVVIIGFFFIWIRAILPRFRYDQLMELGWKTILPISLSYLFFSINCLYLFGGFDKIF